MTQQAGVKKTTWLSFIAAPTRKICFFLSDCEGYIVLPIKKLWVKPSFFFFLGQVKFTYFLIRLEGHVSMFLHVLINMSCYNKQYS